MSLSLYDNVTIDLCVSVLHTTDLSTIIQLVPNTSEHALVNTLNNCCDALL
jgi:hypothetical protein